MGAWGHKAYDNDTASDFCAKLENEPITSVIQEGLASKNYDEIRVAAWLLTKVGHNFVYPLELLKDQINFAIQRLYAIYCDTEWLNQWSHPEKVTRDLEKTRAKLEKRLGVKNPEKKWEMPDAK